MPEYLSPGIYVEEVNSGPKPIEGVGTAMAAFVGFAPGGPVNKPVLITNWSQYVETFGVAENGGKRNPHRKGAYLSHAVYGYFLNGGGRCYVTGLGSSKAPAQLPPALQLPSKASKSVPSFALQAKEPQADDIEIEVKQPSGDQPPDGTFTLRVRMGSVEEVYENITIGKSRSARNLVETVNPASRLVTVLEVQSTGTLA